MAGYDVVNFAEIAHVPEGADRSSSSALDLDYQSALVEIARKLGVVARVRLGDGDDAAEVQNAIKAAGLSDHFDTKTFASGSFVYFYVNGPQPDEFIRQYRISGH